MAYIYTYAQVIVPAGTRQILALIENPDFNANADLYYKVDTTLPAYNINNTPVSYGFTALTASNLISVQNNNYVTFSVMGKNVAPVTSKVTVVSMPDFTQLGSFTVNVVTVGGGPDPTPNPVNWGDVVYEYLSGIWSVTSQQLTGFTTEPITLSVTIQTVSGTTPELWFTTSAGDPADGWINNQPPVDQGYGRLFTLDPIDIYPDEWLAFATNGGLSAGVATVTVRNVSDGNAILDTFNITVTAGGE